MSYKIYTTDRKSTENRDIWCKDGRVIYVSTTFRWGYAVIEKKPKIPKLDESLGLAVSSLGEIETYSLDDGSSEEVVFPGDFSDQEREEIEEAWDEEGENGLSKLGWLLEDWDIVFHGPIKVEKYIE